MSSKPMPNFFNATPVEEIEEMVESARDYFQEGETLEYEYRRQQLMKLYQAVEENKEVLISAVHQYLGRSRIEIGLTEITNTLSEIAHLINNLQKYMEPEPIQRAAINAFDKCEYQWTPLGVVSIISPWNFPVSLTLKPLAGAIAAGCTVIVKPSEVSGRVASIIAELMYRYLDRKAYKCVLGEIPQATELLKQNVDLIFYTGNCAVGKIVMRAAAEHLTPVVLELGGQNPVVVDKNVDLSIVAKRIMWGRLLNAGQVCLSPEYVLCPRESQDELIEEMAKVIKEWYGENPKESPYFGRIVNRKHFHRLETMLKECEAQIAVGGDTDEFTRYISPTILRDIDEDHPFMEDETFGPIIGIYPLDDLDEAVDIIHERGKPLALYVFSNNQDFIDEVVESTDSGGVTINDTIMHHTVKGFHFGGIGKSGMGQYHGKDSFAAFSHKKPVLHKSLSMEFVNNVRNPPYTEFKASVFRGASEEKINSWSNTFRQFAVAVGLGAAAYFVNSKL